MTSSVSETSIVNRSLLGIGSRSQISNLNENSKEANAAATLYTPTYEQIARSAYWNCFRKQATLSLLKAANGTPENPQGTSLPFPPTPWLYSYQIPADSLKIRTLVPSLPSAAGGIPVTGGAIASPIYLPTGEGQIPFAVAYDVDANNNPIQVVLTNQSQAQAVYTVNQPNPSIWDSQFQGAMVAGLGAFFVPALTLHLPLMQIAIQAAERIITAARTSDANEGIVSQNREADWIRARRQGSYFINGYGGGQCWGGYDNVCWPG